MEKCPCGSDKNYDQCCQPLIQGETPAQNPEALMRSRYSAYVKSETDYIFETTHPDKRDGINKKEIATWSRKADWQSLEIVNTEEGGPEDTKGVVEFIAKYRMKEKPTKHHEIAQFEKFEDRWYFTDGQPPVQSTVIRETPKVGRNDPCPCGSGKKFKKCCGA